MIPLEEFQQLKARAERRRREADKASGVLEQSYKELKEKFGCSTLAQARPMLKKKLERLASVDKEMARKIKQFEDEFGERLF